jgi:hypothetical protein
VVEHEQHCLRMTLLLERAGRTIQHDLLAAHMKEPHESARHVDWHRAAAQRLLPAAQTQHVRCFWIPAFCARQRLPEVRIEIV